MGGAEPDAMGPDCSATTGVVAQLLFLQALKYATAATLGRSTTRCWCLPLIGLLVFGELPDTWTVVGACLVIAGGMYAIKAKG